MACMKANETTVARGLANYTVQGLVYRLIGPARNAPGNTPACIQTYFYDQEEQVRLRLQRIQPNPQDYEREAEIFRTLARIMHAAPNVYLASYLSIQEQIDAGNIPEDIQVGIHAYQRPDGEHARRFNLPTSNELAILLPNVHHDQASRTIVCNYRAANNPQLQLQHFSDTHRSYDPLVYPLLFPFGTDGYHPGIPLLNSNRTLTAKQFYSFRLMVHADSFNILHRNNKLFQQYCVGKN